VLAAVTFFYLGPSLDAALWASAQVVLVALAGFDVESRRLPNRITLPVAAVAVALRAAFERDALVEVVVAGLASFAVFWVMARLMRGGLGMGDVKLAGMLGFLLGNAALPALVLGVFAGGVWAAILLGSGRAGLRSSIAYGQFLALGGAVAILVSSPPPLV
jgi:leader peptidase (prepilin peptidase) / N-methyltransferase